jgi:hypothetical protein
LPEIYLWENFLSPEELVPIMEEINSKEWENTRKHDNIKILEKYRERILNSIEIPDGSVSNINQFRLKRTNDGMLPHIDIWNCLNPIFTNEIEKDADVEKSSFEFPRYAFVIYFNDDYQGGDICYPEYNFCYKPKAGSLVVHEVKVIHAVKKVASGNRYYHQGMLVDKIWVEKSIADGIEIPNPFIVDHDNPLYFDSVDHGPTDNLRLEEFKKTFVNDGTYV